MATEHIRGLINPYGRKKLSWNPSRRNLFAVVALWLTTKSSRAAFWIVQTTAVARSSDYDNLSNYPSLENRPAYNSETNTLSWIGPEGGGPSTSSDQHQSLVLANHSGDLTINRSGVTEGLNISGSVFIYASSVTLRRCRVRTSGFTAVQIGNAAMHPSKILIEDCLIDGTGSAKNGQNGIWNSGNGGDGAYRRNNITNIENGIVPGSGDTLIDNWIHDLYVGSGSPHYDGVQMDGGQSNVNVEHNTIINPHDWTSDVMMDNYFGSLNNITVHNNQLLGPSLQFTLYSDASFNNGSINNISITNNVMQHGSGSGHGYFFFRNSNPAHSGNTEFGSGNPID
jgi:hypothetical protein